MNKLLIALLLLFPLFSHSILAQDAKQTDQIKALNNYVKFTNESIHGMLIVHRMFENFNQEVNKYVDLQSNQLNFYGNKDLPKDIFDDPEHWFYPVSPLELFDICKKNNQSLNISDAANLNQSINGMKVVINQVNAIRFELDDFISANDLSKSSNQAKIYMMLERCVKLYDDFYQAKEEIGRMLADIHQRNITVKSNNFSESVDLLVQLHQVSKELLEAMRFGYEKSIPNHNSQLSSLIKKVKASKVNQVHFQKAIQGAEELRALTKKYLSQSKYADKYKLYGKDYYYHNVELIAVFNRYGAGMVNHINEYINLTNPSSLALLEQPHYYKVIYPKKEVKLPDNQPLIGNLPTSMKDREIVVKQQQIKVDEKKLLLEIYDHKEEDGDIISLNFNGNWIIEKRKIGKKAIKMIIDLNQEGENFLILHAENLGDTPPNTIAIRYHYEGKRKLVILNSDLNESELIQINYTK